MKRYMLLHVGFATPSPDLMASWGTWLESIRPHSLDQGGFHGAAREVTRSGVRNLPRDAESITGYNIVMAEDLAAAEAIAARNPFVTSVRVYEIK